MVSEAKPCKKNRRRKRAYLSAIHSAVTSVIMQSVTPKRNGRIQLVRSRVSVTWVRETNRWRSALGMAKLCKAYVEISRETVSSLQKDDCKQNSRKRR